MKKIIFYFLIVLSSIGFSQCPEGDVSLLSQEEVDDFLINYPDCMELNGDLIIQSTVAPITNLFGLQNIEKVEGTINIWWCYDLFSLEGLNNLKNVGNSLSINQTNIGLIENIFDQLVTIGGNLYIHSNTIMTLVNDFHNIEFIGGNVTFDQNDNLLNITAFENLENINGGLSLRDKSLEDISGFENLISIGGDFHISIEQSPIIEITPFENLNSVGGNLRILSIPIEDLDWLSNLNMVGGYVWIMNNPKINNLLGISNIQSINGEIALYNSGINLTSLDGIENINYLDIVQLGIIGNQSLIDCSKPNICQYLANGGEYLIENNATGCNSAEEILMNCEMNTSDEDLNNKVTIFPNPAKDKLSIISNGLMIREIELYSINGKLLYSSKVEKNNLDVSKYPSGNYILTIKIDKGKISKKILIAH